MWWCGVVWCSAARCGVGLGRRGKRESSNIYLFLAKPAAASSILQDQNLYACFDKYDIDPDVSNKDYQYVLVSLRAGGAGGAGGAGQGCGVHVALRGPARLICCCALPRMVVSLALSGVRGAGILRCARVVKFCEARPGKAALPAHHVLDWRRRHKLRPRQRSVRGLTFSLAFFATRSASSSNRCRC